MNEITPPPEPIPQGSVASPAFDGKHVHMIGIGGCGMSGAAAMLRSLGSPVSGSDRRGARGQTDHDHHTHTQDEHEGGR